MFSRKSRPVFLSTDAVQELGISGCGPWAFDRNSLGPRVWFGRDTGFEPRLGCAPFVTNLRFIAFYMLRHSKQHCTESIVPALVADGLFVLPGQPLLTEVFKNVEGIDLCSFT